MDCCVLGIVYRVQCSGVVRGVVWCGVVWCGVVWCGVVWCGVVWCGVLWCCAVCGVVSSVVRGSVCCACRTESITHTEWDMRPELSRRGATRISAGRRAPSGVAGRLRSRQSGHT
jgi:hypothetical protein